MPLEERRKFSGRTGKKVVLTPVRCVQWEGYLLDFLGQCEGLRDLRNDVFGEEEFCVEKLLGNGHFLLSKI